MFCCTGSHGEKLEIEYTYDKTGRVQVYKHRYEGLLKMLDRWYEDTSSNQVRDWVESFMATNPCGVCTAGGCAKKVWRSAWKMRRRARRQIFMTS